MIKRKNGNLFRVLMGLFLVGSYYVEAGCCGGPNFKAIKARKEIKEQVAIKWECVDIKVDSINDYSPKVCREALTKLKEVKKAFAEKKPIMVHLKSGSLSQKKLDKLFNDNSYRVQTGARFFKTIIIEKPFMDKSPELVLMDTDGKTKVFFEKQCREANLFKEMDGFLKDVKLKKVAKDMKKTLGELLKMRIKHAVATEKLAKLQKLASKSSKKSVNTKIEEVSGIISECAFQIASLNKVRNDILSEAGVEVKNNNHYEFSLKADR